MVTASLNSILDKLGLTRVIHKSLIRLGFSSLRWYPYLDSYFDGIIPPRELWVGSGDPLSHFLRWPYEYRAYLTLLCEMRQDASVLELGCHHGRTMLALPGYLQPPGRYEGLDILAKQIEFAQRNIHSRFPVFNFTHADIYNTLYNPNGRLKAEDYSFPYSNDYFDIIYAASVFTHLLPPSSSNYFKQSRRVLRKGGQCLFSFFVLDSYRGPGTSVAPLYEFNHPLEGYDGVAVYNSKLPPSVPISAGHFASLQLE